ncbi:MAG: hypothetical protein M3619_17990 [Myxococcota bacterium]|nr:hypothetical protein [Myxococcota bacterium]
MRNSIVITAVLGMFAAACAGTIDDVGGGGGDDTGGGPDCGNGVVDTGEACDDGNTTSGDGCSAGCSSEQVVTPRVSVSLDKTAISTELKTSNMVVVTVTGADGFSGAVNLTGAVLDGASAPVQGWAVVFNTPTVNVPLDGTATAVATLTIPSQFKGVTNGMLKIDAASTAAPQSAMATVAVANQLTFTLNLVNNQCAYPMDGGTGAAQVEVAIGTKVRFFNAGAANLEIHSNNAAAIPHQGQVGGTDDPITESQTAYEKTLAGTVGGTVNWYCHAPGPNLQGGNPTMRIVAAP